MYNNNNKVKTFTIIDFPNDNETFGKYKSSIPKKAANKAFIDLLKYIDLKKNNEDDFFGKFIVFVIKDIETNKMYKYIGTLVKLNKPITKNTNNKRTVYYYKSVIGKYNKELDQLK
jgi:hypothetical protein